MLNLVSASSGSLQTNTVGKTSARYRVPQDHIRSVSKNHFCSRVEIHGLAVLLFVGAEVLLHVQVGTESISPLLWAIDAGWEWLNKADLAKHKPDEKSSCVSEESVPARPHWPKWIARSVFLFPRKS